MFETFRARAQAVSAEVHRVPSPTHALDLVVDVLREAGVADAPRCGAVWADGPFLASLDRVALERRVPGLRFEVTRAAAAEARVGVSEMDWAVANTGTLAQAADAVEQRLASTLPGIHVALVPASRLVPDLSALFAVLGPERSRYVALVTGPSRTADIERVLTIGVHGPERLVIVVVDDLQGRSR
jgi:L-lactate dehydrogenase complex protein LldG